MRFASIFGLALLLLTASLAQARPVHFFDCKDCHTATVDLYSIGSTNLCLKCHKDTPPAVTFNDLTPGHLPNGLFHPNDASDALNSATAVGQNPTQQTSHFWAGKKDVVPAAGALAPTKPLYTSRYGISTGKVTCTRCHDPHLPIETDPKLLRMTAAGDLICLDCHRPWKLSNNQGRETHPIVADYAAAVAASPTKYKASVTNIGSGGVQLVGGGVSCSSCHGVHFADSHSGTVDGRDNRAGLLAGDGKLLRTDGPKRTGADAAATAQLRSNLCQACHTYKTHGENNPIGCLECHSGHSYNNGSPNYFVLRGSIASVYVPKNAAVGAVNNLLFTTATAEWMNPGGTGYCQNCHTLVAPHNGLNSGNGSATSCGECHNHGHADRSFTASCADCHGTPPSSALAAPASGGYAKSGALDYSTSGFYKDESLTPHGNHAGGSDYRFSCDACHLGKSHASGSFQDVFLTPHSLASGAGGTVPAYNGAGSGTCSAVYCHSNGGKRTGDASSSYKTVAVTWAGQKNTINSCDACHGNSAATMLAASRDNSTSHQKHLAKGYDCSVCHANTASSATALVGGAIGTTHVNGSADVSYDNSYELSVGRPLGAGSYASVAGTCSIYCHSNGQGVNATPDWDVAASGACGTCHAARPGDAAVISSGSHSKHVSDVNGPQLGCDACHGAGAGTGGHATHVNGMVNAPAASICTSCHAVDAGETTPVWGNSSTSTCESCHSGATVSTINSKTAPAKPLAASSGHNKPSGSYTLSGNAAANRSCVACHDAASAGHFGTSGDARLTGGFACSSCHAGELTHQAKACVACHDPHGSSNGYMIYSTQAAQNAKDGSASGKFGGDVVFSATTGADSYDEADGVNTDDICASCHTATSHNNRAATGFHRAGDLRGSDCTQCHTHAKAFRPVGTACNQCHGNAPNSGAHAYHALVADQTTAEDRSDCAVCHTGAELYTYDPMDDIANGRNHSDATGRKTLLTASVGFNTGNQTCTSACHKSSVADGAWADADGLNCDSCHYWSATPTSAGNAAYVNAAAASAPLSGKHTTHFAITTAPVVCGDCHGTVTTDLTFKRGHNNFKTAVADADKIRYQGYQQLNPGGLSVLVDDSARNHGNGNTFVNGAPVANGDNLNTCSNIACHNPSNDGHKADWEGAISGFCSYCHGFGPTTASHNVHLLPWTYGNSTDVFAKCSACHPYSASNNHRNGTLNVNAGLGYTGNVTDFSNTTWGSCGTGSCHNNGRAGTPAVAITWGTAQAATCALCHAATPTSGAHTGHVSAAYGPLTGSDCSRCHLSNANNTDMTGQVTHMNATRNLIGGNLTATTACNTCHGSAGAVTTAKANWPTATKVSCESCHGTTASLAVIGVTAPDKSNYASKGHGKAGVAKACTECHDSAVAHISGSLGDATRLLTLGGKTWGGDPNGYCGVCHVKSIKVHYANTQTAGGTSDTATACATCHDPHGEVGNTMDAMVLQTIAGKTVTGFADKTQRSSYYITTPNAGANVGKYGICQVCHDSAEVSFFNRSIESNATHMAGATVCITCHDHTNNPGFKASCTACHNNGIDDGQLINSAPATGAHAKHIASNAYVNDCDSCHGVGANTASHAGHNQGNGTVLPANASFGNAVSSYTAANGTCSNTCHAVVDGRDWTSAALPTGERLECMDCHTGTYIGGGANRPTSGLHSIVPTVSGVTHDDAFVFEGALSAKCQTCHTASPSSAHLDGTLNTSAPTITFNAAIGFADAATPTCAPAGGTDIYGNSLTGCHGPATGNGDQGTWNRKWSTTAANSNGTECANCHGTFALGWTWNEGNASTTDHTDPYAGNTGDKMRSEHSECLLCHGWDRGNSYYNKTWATGDHGDGKITINGGAAAGAGYTTASGGCARACHSDAFVMKTNSGWTEKYPTSSIGSCDACHGSDRPTVMYGASTWGGKNINMVWQGGNATGKTTTYGSHLKINTGESFATTTNWAAQCMKCHPYHSFTTVDATVPLPTAWNDRVNDTGTGTGTAYTAGQMQAKLGLDYTATGGAGAIAGLTSGSQGIHLGGSATTTASWYYNSSAKTEAEMCWGCHGLDTAINEWGYNADTNGATWPETSIAPDTTTPTGHTYWAGPAGKGFNHGYLYTAFNRAAASADAGFTGATSKWVDASGKGMYRRDAYQNVTGNSYVMSQRISSVHSVNFSVLPSTGSSVRNNIHTDGMVKRLDTAGNYQQAAMETAGQIRCSYCHDLHDMNKATSDNSSGRPHLRGSWMGNPYAPDMPPISTYTYPSTGGSDNRGNRYFWGSNVWTTDDAVPRLFVSTGKNKGGYFIDQNSNWPTKDASYDTPAETAGICTLCHGSDVDNMDYYTGSKMWRTDQANGHANSTLGGSGATHGNARNIFDGKRGASAYIFMGFQDQTIPRTVSNWGKNSYDGVSANGSAPYRQFGQPGQSTTAMPGQNSGWYGGTERVDYTNDANRLTNVPQYGVWFYGSTDPLQTAAIGTDGSTGAIRAHSFSCSKCHNPHAAGLPALLTTNCLDRTVSNWVGGNKTTIRSNPTNAWVLRTQNNCHRKDDVATGWHKLAPGQ